MKEGTGVTQGVWGGPYGARGSSRDKERCAMATTMTRYLRSLLAALAVLAMTACVPRVSPTPAEPALAAEVPATLTVAPAVAETPTAANAAPVVERTGIDEIAQTVASFDKGGFDPILLAQDVPETIAVDPALIDGNAAMVVVSTSFEGHTFTVRLMREGDIWRIDGVVPDAGDAAETGR